MRILEAIKQAGRKVLHMVGRVLDTARHWLTAAAHAIRDAATRHQDRASDDRVYARAMATAASELAATIITRPWLATALAVAVAGILTPEDHEPRGTVVDEDDYQDVYRPPRPTSRPFTAPRPSPQPTALWDRLD